MKKLLALSILISGISFANANKKYEVFTLENQQISVIVKSEVAAGEKYLPPLVKIDDEDLEDTMKIMGKNLRNLRRSEDKAELLKATQNLAKYSAQAQLLGEESEKFSQKSKDKYIALMQKLRVQLVLLEEALNQGEMAKAKDLIKQIVEVKEDGHDYFEVK